MFSLFTSDKILDLSEFKAFAVKKVTFNFRSVFERVENIMEQEWQIVAKYAHLTPSCNHPRNFIAIASIVLEICTGQNSSMKINKGQ